MAHVYWVKTDFDRYIYASAEHHLIGAETVRPTDEGTISDPLTNWLSEKALESALRKKVNNPDLEIRPCLGLGFNYAKVLPMKLYISRGIKPPAEEFPSYVKLEHPLIKRDKDLFGEHNHVPIVIDYFSNGDIHAGYLQALQAESDLEIEVVELFKAEYFEQSDWH